MMISTSLSKALNNSKIPFRYINNIRETTDEGLKIGFEISQRIKKDLKKYLGENIYLISPIKKSGDKIINTNADDIVTEIYKNYNRIIVYTLNGRNKQSLSKIPHLEVRKI